MTEDTKVDGRDGSRIEEPADVETFLHSNGIDTERTILTRRQVKVLVVREFGCKQAAIADHLETTRENVTGIETRARENIEKAHETIELAEILSAPIRVEIPAETDLYDAPDLVFDACDDAGVKVGYNAPELLKLILDAAGSAVDGRQIRTPLLVNVTSDGTVRIRKL